MINRSKPGNNRILTAAVAVTLLWAALSGVPGAVGGETTVRLEITLSSSATGKPIKNASVYAKFKEKRRFRRDKGREWMVKTNPEGRAIFPRLPEGRVLIQIVAPGWRTYGKFHELEGKKIRLEIKLERPPKWF